MTRLRINGARSGATTPLTGRGIELKPVIAALTGWGATDAAQPVQISRFG